MSFWLTFAVKKKWWKENKLSVYKNYDIEDAYDGGSC